MSVSVIFSTRIPAMSSSLGRGTGVYAAPMITGGGMGMTIECSSRPQKKATAHHMKTRPRKSQPWDIRRGPAVYPPLPPLPPDWTVVGTVSEADVDVEVADAAPPQNE